MTGGTAPILIESEEHAEEGGEAAAEAVAGVGAEALEAAEAAAEAILYSNPIPHVLMLTAIVVGVATTRARVELVVVRINEAYRHHRGRRDPRVPGRGPVSEHLPATPGRGAAHAGAARGAREAQWRAAWAVAAAACWFGLFGIAVALLQQRHGPTVRSATRWAAGCRPYGIEYRIDLATHLRRDHRCRPSARSSIPFARASVAKEVAEDRGAALLRGIHPLHDRASWHRGDRGRLQRLRLPRDLVALRVRAHRAGHGPSGADGRRSST